LLLDYLVVLAWLAALALWSAVTWSLTGSPPTVFTASALSAQVASAVTTVVPVGVYLWAGESGVRQATWGKRRAGLLVVGPRGQRASRGRVAVRTVVKLLPWQVAHVAVLALIDQTAAQQRAEPSGAVLAALVGSNVLALVWLLCVVLTPDRRGVHDLAAGTRVVLAGGTPSAQVAGRPAARPAARPRPW
jgi:uncharacterized RDD family membrane protein YckC